jgi:CPA2 family monovalent cation:H+ antiporter-2
MSDANTLRDILIILLALLAVVPLFQRLRLGSVLAYLVIGLLIGPPGLGLIREDESTHALAEMGVVFLLFSIGLEISVERLRLFGRRAYTLALAQVLVTTGVIAAIATLFGIGLAGALLIGGALGVSSTAVVLQLLGERGQMAGQLGRTAIAILLVQDLTVAPMIVLASAADVGQQALLAELGLAVVKFAVFCLLVAAGERTVLRPLLKLAAGSDSPEVFTAAALLLVLGIGWMSETVGLSMALGAFVAGLLVADTEFRHQVSADIEPVRGLLLGLFFISVGMGLDLHYALDNIILVTVLVVLIIAVKFAVLFALALLAGLRRGRAAALAALLAQGSEFAFVLLPLGVAGSFFSSMQAQLLAVAVTLSMMLTPMGAMLLERLASRFRREPSQLGNLDTESGALRGHVVIAGFGQVGMAVARFLAGEGVPLLILDLTPRRVTASRTRGLPVFYGNAARRDVLRAAGLERAQALVVAVPDPAAAEQITAIARQGFRHLRIFTRAPEESWVSRMRTAGADAVVLESLTTALDLAERVMLVHEPISASNQQ